MQFKEAYEAMRKGKKSNILIGVVIGIGTTSKAL